MSPLTRELNFEMQGLLLCRVLRMGSPQEGNKISLRPKANKTQKGAYKGQNSLLGSTTVSQNTA